MFPHYTKSCHPLAILLTRRYDEVPAKQLLDFSTGIANLPIFGARDAKQHILPSNHQHQQAYISVHRSPKHKYQP